MKSHLKFTAPATAALTLAAALTLLGGFSDGPRAQASSTRYVTAKYGLRMRSRPSLRGKRVATIPAKAQVYLIREYGRTQVMSGKRGRWSYVRWNKRAGWVFGGFLSRLRPGAKAGMPRITILSPGSGWTAKKIVVVKGMIESSEPVREARFTQNGISRSIPVNSGRFSQKIVLGSGANYIKIEATNAGGTSAAALKLVTNNSPMDMKVVLSWDTNNTDVDLWVTDPNNEKVSYRNKRSKIGGQLDVDITSGYGPETFTLARALPGEYLVQVQYYGGARPTMARVLVVLYEGTPKEKRLTFPALLHKRGSGITIGRFKVD